MSTLDTQLTAEEEKAVKDKVYETLSDDIKKVVDDLKDNKTENDEVAKQNITKLSKRLDKGFYDYCKEKFKDQIPTIQNAINTALGKFPNNTDLIKLQRFVEGTKTFTDNTKTETFSGTGRLINSMNASPEQKRKLDQDLKDLSNKIDTLVDHDTNLYKLLDAMRTVTKTGVGGQNLQYYLYTELPADQKANFLAKNAKRGVSHRNIGPNTFDGIIGYYSLLEYILNTKAKIDKYNQDKQDINSDNAVFNQLMGNSTENTRIINEALEKAKAEKARKEAEEEGKRKIEAGLQNQTDFIDGIKGINDIPEEGKQKVLTKLQSLQARYDEEINRTNRNETLLRSLQDLQKNPVLIYQRILIGEKIKERINTLQTNLHLQEQKIKPEDLTGTGFEIKNNLVVISSDFEKALKNEDLRDPEEIPENKSDQRENREKAEEGLIKQLSELPLVHKCANYLKKRYELQGETTADGNSIKQEIKDQWIQDLDAAAKADGTLAKIQTLKNMGIHFNEKGDIKNINNGVNRSKIQEFINDQKPSSDQQTSVDGG